MIRKMFLICLVMLLSVQVAAAEPVPIALELDDTSRHKNIGTAQILGEKLNAELVKKKFVNVVERNVLVEPSDEDAEIGELLVFDAVELPATTETPQNFDGAFYEVSGAKYVIRSEVLGLGLTKVDDDTFGIVADIVGTGLSFASKESVQYVGTGIAALGYIQMERTALAVVVNVQFIDVANDKVLWQENFIGRAVKHHNAGKNYKNIWSRAYDEAIADTARRIAKRVNKYVDKVLIKGKTDKSSASNVKIGGLVGGSF